MRHWILLHVRHLHRIRGVLRVIISHQGLQHAHDLIVFSPEGKVLTIQEVEGVLVGVLVGAGELPVLLLLLHRRMLFFHLTLLNLLPCSFILSLLAGLSFFACQIRDRRRR